MSHFRESIERMIADPSVKEIKVADVPSTKRGDSVSLAGLVFDKPLVFRVRSCQVLVDFTGCTFEQDVSFDDCSSSRQFNFSACTFKGPANFFRLTFANHGWLANAVFGKARFESTASFQYAHFGETAESNNCADFNGTVFLGETRFNNCVASGWISFTNCRFEQNVSFERAKFNGRTVFSDAKFSAGVTFKHASFKQANFNKAIFGDAAAFVEVTMPNQLEPDPNSIFGVKGFLFREVKLLAPELVEFRGREDQHIDLSCVSFLSTDVSNVIFVDEKWGSRPVLFGLRSRNATMDEKLIEHGIEYLEHPLGSLLPSFGKVKQLYRRLRHNYERAGRYAEAGDFFIGEMEMRRLDVKNVGTALRWIYQNFSLLGLYKHLSLYGESYPRLGAWSGAIILTFAAIRTILLPGVTDVTMINRFFVELGNSIAAFMQMPISSTGFDVAERITSAPLLALLVISLKRNFERK
ncbi:MAG: hypothetical protein GQ542_04390 [Desulforhopalus sp.]|nr:hypothetical protein [Desulforhopalus sp.]